MFRLFIFYCCISFACAQSALPTEKVLSVQVSRVSAEEFLQYVSQQTQVKFSYNPQIFAGLPTFSLSLRSVSVREALYQAFGNAIKLKAKGNYIILQKTNLPIQAQQAESRPLRVHISGYVIDKKTQQKIPYASVYERGSLAATLTNEYGFFQLQIETHESQIELSFAKVHYIPQNAILPTQNTPFTNVQLEPIEVLNSLPSQGIMIPKDTLRGFRVFIPQAQVIHTQNVKESFWRKMQFSLLPMVGTNHVLSGLVRNKISFNALIGYNAGVSQFELGGIANINKGDVEGVQVGGILNATAGKVKGVQVGGILNVVTDSVSGVQVGGIANSSLKFVDGVQVGGILNTSLSGFRGVQVGGILNVNLHKMKGVQVGGLVNVALGKMEGVQVAGILNVAGKSKNGWQIGLFNYADSSRSLKQIGLVNFVRRGGYKNMELSTNEMLFTDFTLRSGTPYFYTLARIGIKYYPERPFWHYGYGVGVRIAQWRTWESNTEWLAYHLIRSLGKDKNIRVFENFGGRYQLYLTKYMGKRLAISLAGALDLQSLHREGIDYEQAKSLSNTLIFSRLSFQRDWRLSWGGTLGLRYRW